MIESFYPDGGWWATGHFLSGDDGNGVRWVRRANFVLSDDAKVVRSRGPQVEHSSYVLLRARYKHSVDVSFPGTLANFVLNDVSLDGAVSVIRRGP